MEEVAQNDCPPPRSNKLDRDGIAKLNMLNMSSASSISSLLCNLPKDDEVYQRKRVKSGKCVVCRAMKRSCEPQCEWRNTTIGPDGHCSTSTLRRFCDVKRKLNMSYAQLANVVVTKSCVEEGLDHALSLTNAAIPIAAMNCHDTSSIYPRLSSPQQLASSPSPPVNSISWSSMPLSPFRPSSASGHLNLVALPTVPHHAVPACYCANCSSVPASQVSECLMLLSQLACRGMVQSSWKICEVGNADKTYCDYWVNSINTSRDVLLNPLARLITVQLSSYSQADDTTFSGGSLQAKLAADSSGVLAAAHMVILQDCIDDLQAAANTLVEMIAKRTGETENEDEDEDEEHRQEKSSKGRMDINTLTQGYFNRIGNNTSPDFVHERFSEQLFNVLQNLRDQPRIENMMSNIVFSRCNIMLFQTAEISALRTGCAVRKATEGGLLGCELELESLTSLPTAAMKPAFENALEADSRFRRKERSTADKFEWKCKSYIPYLAVLKFIDPSNSNPRVGLESLEIAEGARLMRQFILQHRGGVKPEPFMFLFSDQIDTARQWCAMIIVSVNIPATKHSSEISELVAFFVDSLTTGDKAMIHFEHLTSILSFQRE